MTAYRVRQAAGLAAAGMLLAGCGGPEPAASGEVRQPWPWAMPQCVAYQPADYQAPAHRRSVEVRDEPGVTAHVETYQDGWGPRAVEEIRVVVAECARYEHGESGDAAFLEQNRIVETGFAGDESLLVETVRLAPPSTQTRYAAAVRHGDVVVTVRASELSASETRQRAAAVPESRTVPETQAEAPP